MSELKRPGDHRRTVLQDDKGRDWAHTDAIQPDEDDWPSPYEPTYRDGSVKNECWNDG